MYFCPANSRRLPACLIYGLFRPLPFRFSGPACEDQQIILTGFGALANFGDLFGPVAFQPLNVVVDTETALLAVCLQLVTLFAAELTGIRDMNRNQWQSMLAAMSDPSKISSTE